VNIQLEFIGFPIIYDLFPEGPHLYALEGNTLVELIEDLIAQEDSRVKEALLDPGTKSLDPTIQVMVNQKFISRAQLKEQKVEENSHVTFFKLLAGG